MNQSQNVDQLFTALSKVQASLQGAKKDASNPFFKSKYADLESCWDACRKLLTDNGLCVIQTMGLTTMGVEMLITTLGHTSGQWIRGELPLNMKSKDPQGQGSAISYARRYSLAAIVGLVQTDDDGEAAMARGPQGKGMVEPGNGIQKEGFRLGTLPKELIDELGVNLSGTMLDEVEISNLNIIRSFLECKYAGRDMPEVTQNTYMHVVNEIKEVQSGRKK